MNHPVVNTPFARILAATAVVAATILAVMAFADSASAATVTRSGNLIWFTAGTGETNKLRITGGDNWNGEPSPHLITISDVVTITPGTGCRRSYRNVPTEVTCGLGHKDLLAGFFLFDGNDFIFSPGNMLAKLYFYGGAGNDDLEASDTQEFSSYLDGEAGNDRLFAGNSKYGDTLYGGDGNDLIRANNGFKDKIACDKPSSPVSGTDIVYADYSSIDGPNSALYGCNTIYRRAAEW